MAASDAGALARSALLSSESKAEAITVNQRALIDKILARYSAEFTVYRELIQNAEDAGATHCELRFDSVAKGQGADATANSVASPTLPDFKAVLASWTFRNNGAPFGKDDWVRLQRIAEGNPDPDRVGAFGVGFYSLFSICEEPIVQSGDELLGFFWKGDSLFTRKAQAPPSEASPTGVPWTTFFMTLREPAPFVDTPLALSRFLATSLTFTQRVRSISLYWDSVLLCKLDKKLDTAKPLQMPGHLNTYSPQRMMRVQSLETTAVQIEAQVMKAVLAGAERERPSIKDTFTSAFTKGSGGGLTSMLQSAFGRSKDKAKEVALPAVDRSEEEVIDEVAKKLVSVSANVHLRIATANVGVTVDKSFQREIERSTKKPPPKVTAFSLIFTGKEEYDASVSSTQAADGSSDSGKGDAEKRGIRQIFEGIMPNLEEQGHVFIGFRTHQTTGFCGHVAARFIPTVERESLDFVDKYCAQWNIELVSMGGYVSRAMYEAELQDIGRLWQEKIGSVRPEADNEDAVALLERALHTMRFFTFRVSAPAPRLSRLFEQTFFQCARQATIQLMSTRGPKHSAAVRFPNATLADFVKDLPVLHPDHVRQADDFVAAVRSRNLVADITMADVFSELSGRALSPSEMVACLKWWLSVAAHPSYDPSLRARLLESAMLRIPAPKGADVSEERIQAIGSVATWLNPQRIPTDVPLPNSNLHFEVSKALNGTELESVFNWTELSLPAWIAHLIRISSQTSTPTEESLTLSPLFAERVFGVLARVWNNLPAQRHRDIAALLKDVSCLPTRKGMQKPNDAYFASVSLFSDLPIVSFPAMEVRGNLEKVLVALGVRKHVELQMIFDRLVAAGDWSHVELLTYLANNKDSLSQLERDRLKKTAIFPKQGETGPPGKDGKAKTIRYRASQLYEPTEALQALGLPLLAWHGKAWRTSSEEGKFATELGLLTSPPLDTLLSIAANPSDEKLRSSALSYFFTRFVQIYSQQYTAATGNAHAFVPAEVGLEKRQQLCKPQDVVTNGRAAIMNCAVISPSISVTDVPKLKLRQDPTAAWLLQSLLRSPPAEEKQARLVFEYLSTTSEFSGSDYRTLRSTPFIPVRSRTSKADSKMEVTLVSPENCYFAGGSVLSEAFREVFTYIDFGETAATFLRNAGVVKEPSIEEIARRLVKEPQRFLTLCGSHDVYIKILRQIASNYNRIPSALKAEMRRSAFLIGSKRLKRGPTALVAKDGKQPNLLEDDDLEDDDEAFISDLRRPAEIVIDDDAYSRMLFGSSVFYAPHEDLLEKDLYEQLGSPRLTSLVSEHPSAVGQMREGTKRCQEVTALVMERTPLFLFETRSASKSGRSEIKHDMDWLKKSLEVVEVEGEGLRTTRTLILGTLQETNVQKSSAMCAIRGKKLTLFLAAQMELDWFEVASSLCKHLLWRQMLPDVLLMMNLLSTTLRNLKRRGFHVDKIIAQRKAEREAYEQHMRDQKAQADLAALKAPSERELDAWQKDIVQAFPDVEPEWVRDQLLAKEGHSRRDDVMQDMLNHPYPRRSKASSSAELVKGGSSGSQLDGGSESGASSSGGNLWSTWRQRMRGHNAPSSLAMGTSSIERPPGVPGGWGSGPEVSAAARSAMEGADEGALVRQTGSEVKAQATQPTPMSRIKSDVLQTVQASRPGTSDAVKTTVQQTQVKEASSYCDTTGIEADLRLAGEVGGLRVFVSRDLDPAVTMSENHGALERLIGQVYLPLGRIFGLAPACLHVFCDTEGPAIAFNRGGVIWLNLRYYLVWHDALVRQGKLAEPLISTFMSMCHELAHNKVAAHNSEHGYWTSSIAEHFFLPLADYIGSLEGA